MSSILLKTSKISDKKKLPIGTSKLLGNPDVWEDFIWPFISIDGEDYDLTFMAQINCAEASKYDADNLLPKSGMLYFFYDLDEMPSNPDMKDAATVLYYDGPIENLREMILTDEEGVSLAFNEQRISFETVPTGYISADAPTHCLLGVPSLETDLECSSIRGYQMLFQLDSFETDDAVIDFTDEGVLCFFIAPEKLKELDFSDIRIMQIYS